MIQILMPMAGDGTRFNKGFKPFIEVNGTPLYQWSLKSLSAIKDYSLTFVIKTQDNEMYQIEEKLLESHPQANVIILEKSTLGCLETSLQGMEQMDLDLPLIILDSDLYFNSTSFNEVVSNTNALLQSSLIYFNSNNPWFSYCELKDQEVIRTREKEVISNNAIAGAYCFSSARIFMNHGARFITSKTMTKGEYYISPVYNSLIKEGEIIQSYFCDKYYSLGSPEEVEENIEYLK